jgi:hypothetical protein
MPDDPFSDERRDFMIAVMNFFKLELGIEHVEYNAEKFQIVLNDGGYINLANAFDEFKNIATEEARQEMLHRYLGGLMSTNQDLLFDEVRERLLPAVRDRMLVENQELDASEAKTIAEIKQLTPNLAGTIIGEHYVSMLAVDNKDSISFVAKAIVDLWRIPLEELIQIAMENLRKMSSKGFVEVSDGVFVSGWQDTYDTSRILLTDKVREECKVQGQHLAFLPNRDYVFITGSDDTVGIKIVLDMCKDLENAPRPLYMVPLVLQENAWQVFYPNQFHPCFHELNFARIIGLSGIYAHSKQTLEEKLEEDVFVATYSAFGSEESPEIFTMCVWTCKSLLPKTQWINFMDVDPKTEEGTSLGVARWEDVEQLFGDKFATTLKYPPRVLVGDLDKESLRGLKLQKDFPQIEPKADSEPPVVPFMDAVNKARERFMFTYFRLLEEMKGREKSAPEVMFEQPGDQPLVFRVKRIDYLVNADQNLQTTLIESQSIPIAPREYKTAEGMTLILKSLTWQFVEFACNKFDITNAKFMEWCTYWMDLEDEFPRDENGLGGVLHFVSQPFEEENETVFYVDFGSAPLKCFSSLLEVLSQVGVRNVTVRTPWNTLLRSN